MPSSVDTPMHRLVISATYSFAFI